MKRSEPLIPCWLTRSRRRVGVAELSFGVAAMTLASVAVYGQQRPTPAPATRPAQPQVQNRIVTKAPNPHWTKTDCFVCHEQASGGGVQRIPLTKVNEICWTCHDGKRAHQEVHPVARTFASEDVVKPRGWPTPNDQLSCITCHNFGPGHARGGPRPERNAWMLREYTGGALSDWCAKCHKASPAHKPFNPHVMLGADGQVNVRNCLLCHKVTEGLDRQVRLGKPDLVADPISLCVRCHTRHVDYFTPGHIGTTVPPRIKAYMIAREDAGFEGTLSPDQVGSHAAEGREPELLPLGLNDRVVCSTCHNPHQAGLFPPDSVLGKGAMKVREDEDEPLAMRGLGRGICRGCHNQ